MSLVYVSIGSNIQRYQHIAASLDALNKHFAPLDISPVYESEAVGFDGDNFLNLVVGFHSTLSVAKLAEVLRSIEYDNGRRRDGPKFSARTLDIDILTFDDCQGNVDGVLLPRNEITKNAFVLLPLANIAPDELHPTLGKTYAAMWHDYDKQSQKLWTVEFNWHGKNISILKV